MKNILTLLFLVLALSANAQDTVKHTVDTLNLKEVQDIGISATKLQPITQTKINMSEYSFLLQQQDPFFIIDKATPSIYAQSDNGQQNGYSYMRLRGLDQTRINYNLNGIPLNEMEDQGLYFSNMPGFGNYIGSINVERGIGTSKYGNTSIAGSVDMETKSMSDTTFEVNTLLKNSTNDQYSNMFYSSGINKNGLAVQLGGTYLNANGYKDHSGNQGGSIFYFVGLFKKNNIFKIYGFSGVSHNQLAFYGVPMSVIDTNYKSNGNLISDKDTFKQNMVAINWINYSSSKAKFNTSVYFDNVNGTYNTSNILFGVKSYQFGAMSNMVLERKHNTTNIGINTNIYSRKHFGSDNNGFYDYPQNCQYYSNIGNKEDVIAYVKGTNKHGLINLFYDVQARAVWFHASESKTYKWIFLNPKIGIKTHTDNNNIYMTFGMTQREPTRTDMIQNVIQSDSAYRYGNTDNTKFLQNDTTKLKPEMVFDYEMGYNYHLSNVDFNLNFYSMWINNEYVATGVIDPYSGFMGKQVIKSTMRNGMETNINVNLNRFKLFFNTTLQRSTMSVDVPTSVNGARIPFSPDFIGSIGGSYTLRYFTFGAVEQNVSSMVMSLTDQNYTSTAYTIVNAFADIKWHRTVLSLKVNNLFNNKYYIPAGISGIPTFYVGQLINYSLALKIKI